MAASGKHVFKKPFLPTAVDDTRSTRLGLCNVCSQLHPIRYSDQEQILGSYEELLQRSRSLGPDCGGCDGCAFFCAIFQSSRIDPERFTDLLSRVIVYQRQSLLTKTSSDPSLRSFNWSITFDIVTDDNETVRLPYVDRKEPVPPDPHDGGCFDLIERWNRQCITHVRCSSPTPVVLPKRVIEIPADPSATLKLRTTKDELGQYVILSHCWGGKKIAMLTNLLVARYHEFLEFSSLPRSFQDAVKITRRLGFRYLWIDALCIIQDDAEDWAKEAGNMALYYGLSALMISATTAEDSSKGILRSRDACYSPALGIEKKYCLRDWRLFSDWDIKNSVLATRGWTAQERMLAPRVLHYTSRQMIWECSEGLAYEAAAGRTHERTDSRTVYRKSTHQAYVTKALGQTTFKCSGPQQKTRRGPTGDTTKLHLGVASVWNGYVSEYSPRLLTVATDKLHAIAGIAKMLNCDGELGTYLAGLWSKYLSDGLNWRRGLNVLRPLPVYTAPSWSWASAQGQVHYPGFRGNAVTPPIPTYDETTKSWTEKFHLKLIEQNMVLEDERNVYGAVLEGSYIIVEGPCITCPQLLRLSEDVPKGYETGLDFHLDMSTTSKEEPGQLVSRHRKDVAQDYEGNPQVTRSQHVMRQGTLYDFCMFLNVHVVGTSSEYVDLLLLRWVHPEKHVARRVGVAKLRRCRRDEEDRRPFESRFRAAGWERWALKLV